MIPNTIRLLSVSALLTVMSTAAVGQESLLDIYQRALENDPAIREAEAIYLASSEVRPQARSQLLPNLQLSASTSTNESTNPYPATNFVTGGQVEEVTSTDSERNSEGWGINISQTVFDWGRFVTLKQADKQVAQAEIVYESAKQQLLIRVSEAYFNVLAAEDALAAQVAARESLERQLEQARRRFEVGLIAITDVQSVQAAFDQSIAQEIEAQRVLATEQERLREITGEYITDLAGPEGDLPLMPPDPANADEWVNVALEQNLDVIAARISADVAQDDIRIARSARFPTLSFSSGFSEDESTSLRTLHPSGQTNRSISGTEGGFNWSLDLRVPLFAGGLNSSRIRQSVYQHRASMEAAERVARETERLTRDSYLGVVSSISQVRALAQLVQSAETALRAEEAGFEVGTRTSVDVLISQETLRQAQTDYARARYNYIVNRLLLEQAAGSLSVEDVEQVDGWLEE